MPSAQKIVSHVEGRPAPTSERPSSRHIPALDGWRGIAFLLVFITHYLYSRHLHSLFVRALQQLEGVGWVGVDLFFVLSGFLITGILVDTVDDQHYYRNFIIRRALRIFPLYYTVLFGLLAVTPLLHLQWHRGHIGFFFYVANFSLLSNLDLENLRPYVLLTHFWSLSVEEQFYLLWPVVILNLRKPGRVIHLCVVLSVVALLLRTFFIFFKPGGIVGMQWNYILLPTHMDGLLYGGIAACLVRTRDLADITRRARWVLTLSAVALAILIYKSGGAWDTVAMSTVGFPLLAAFFTSIIVLCLDSRSIAARVGNLRPLRTLGRYSYGLYVYHLLFLPALGPLLGWMQRRSGSTAVGAMLYLFTVFFGVLAVAVASYELYERQFLRLKRYFPYLGSRSAGPDAAIAQA
jgi:peptidoglycan/LPS O-acetylase OafA/YrhL